jgi:hypothetical protein
MDQRHQLLYMVLQALSFFCQRKTTQLLTAWKTNSQPMTCVVKTMEARVQALLEAL